MIKPTVKTRFAPSPTGLLHLGNLRTALFNALYARHHGGVFLLRIEDTDRERSKDEYTQALQRDLQWLDLSWQEGPEVGGPHGPYAQSQREAIYQEYFARLENEGLAYPCFCSEQELKLSRRAQRAAGLPPRYAGTCAHLSEAEVARKLAQGLRPTLRFRVPQERVVTFDDGVRGPQRFPGLEIGDFIIRRADGSPAFFFSNAVDDSLMGVTDVFRGEDHLTNTPRQLLLLEAIGLSAPRYAHISMIVGADGAPLSKRHGSRSVAELREQGLLPGAVVNYLARLGHVFEDNGYLDLDALAAGFSMGRLGRAPARFDEAQLTHWQHEAVAAAPSAELADWLRPRVVGRVPDDVFEDFVETVRPNVATPEDAGRWAEAFFAEEFSPGADDRAVMAEAGEGFFKVAEAAVREHGTEYAAVVSDLKAKTGAKGRGLFMPLRLALTGHGHGPELARILPLMGADRALRRLRRAAEMVKQD